jgi:hypothetical protein
MGKEAKKKIQIAKLCIEVSNTHFKKKASGYFLNNF